ncbi:leucine-rich repeat domain-containing protein [Nannocystis exedens]|uniref:leucine-rich repeat domain-containing protein n=1 Tax=Nannocystis exedens TaxID=54 RepID=UPI0011607DE8|nr:leucine-rich repeat domain-containing protein [Nannocystis exedens]
MPRAGLVALLAACGPAPAEPTTGDGSTAGEPGTTVDDASTTASTHGSTSAPTTGSTTVDATSTSTSTTDDATSTSTSATDDVLTTPDPSAVTGPDTTTGAPACAVVEFADANLEAKVRSVLDIPEGPIPGDVLAALPELGMQKLHTGPIVDLGGLECATGLTALGLIGYAELGDAGVAPLAALTKLENLRLHGSGVTSLAVLAGLTALQDLELQGGTYTDLAPLAGLTALQRLVLDATPVTDLSPLSGLAALEELHLEGTPVTDLSPLAGLATLAALHLEGAPVTDLSPLADLTTLRLLDARKTAVADLAPLAGLVAMEELLLDKTAITDLAPLAGMSALRSLHIRFTAIADLSSLTGLPIHELSASDCQIADVAPVATWPTPGSFSLGNNQITSIAPLLAADWLVDDAACGALGLTGNPLSAQAELDAVTLCDTTLVQVVAGDLMCGGTPGCFMP